MKTSRKIGQVLLWDALILLLTFALVGSDGVLQGDVAVEDPTAGPTFFIAPFYHGGGVTLPVGNYDLVDLNVRGIHDNSISSVKVPPGFRVVTFANPDFTGASIILGGDTPSLRSRGFDHEISSVRISRFTVGATFYSDCPQQQDKRNGSVVTLPLGTYTAHDLLQWGIASDSVSGLVPGSGVEVEVFDGHSFGGKSRLVREVICLANVNDGFDNLTSSLRIRSSKVLFKDDFDSGSLTNWVVASGTWAVQDGKMVNTSGFDPVAYVGPNRSFNGPIVLDVDVEMITGNARVLMDSNGEQFGTEYLAQIWSKNSAATSYANRWMLAGYRDYAPFFPTAVFPGNVDANVLSPI
jgi:hypothetical protein